MTVVPLRSALSIRELAAMLGLIAVLMRVMIAPGLMPDLRAAADGDFKLVICGSGGLKAFAASTGDEAPDNGHDGATDLCPFAALSHLAMLADPPLVGGVPILPDIELTPDRHIVPAPAIRKAHARAPPFFS